MLPILILSRAFVISIKYGYYSKEHYLIFKSTKYPPGFIAIDLIATALMEKDPDNIKSRIRYAVLQLGIEPSSFFIECSKKQDLPKYSVIREQLLSYKKLKENYSEPLLGE
jgi:hypothetical protein